MASNVKTYKHGDPSAPKFPEEFEIVRKAVLQVTDIKSNHNKFYALELHAAPANDNDSAIGSRFRVFTHYGRTDDLENNPDAGQKESRFLDSLGMADAIYQSIYREKTSARKGYKEVSLASSRIGSHKARGTSAGEVDAKTLQKLAETKAQNGEPAPVVKASALPTGVQDLVAYLYDEATHALTSTVAAKITANGIETPLGILTLGQIEKGEAILQQLYALFQSEKKRAREIEQLSGEFYTAIPHRIGRSRAAVGSALIDSIADFESKQETLQLMKDMLKVNGEAGSVLFDSQIDAKYEALRCAIAPLPRGCIEFEQIEQYVQNSQVRRANVRVQNVFTLRRDEEYTAFDATVGNEKLLFHGSRIKNWVGILSRGILLPKIVVSLGVGRTDAGWLGNGIYFGDAACTSANYTSPGKKKTRFMAVARVALGRMKDYTKITYGLAEPPTGFDSCHGVRAHAGVSSQFADDEYVIYRTQQQRLEYLVEFTM